MATSGSLRPPNLGINLYTDRLLMALKKGERKPDVFLTIAQRQEILRYGYRAPDTYWTIAARWNVTESTIRKIFIQERQRISNLEGYQASPSFP
jgi:hypothetical protein